MILLYIYDIIYIYIILYIYDISYQYATWLSHLSHPGLPFDLGRGHIATDTAFRQRQIGHRRLEVGVGHVAVETVISD